MVGYDPLSNASYDPEWSAALYENEAAFTEWWHASQLSWTEPRMVQFLHNYMRASANVVNDHFNGC